MKAYTKHLNTRETHQSKPVPGKKMAKNHAGGYAFKVNDWERLNRFLILGSESPTYYVSQRKLTEENAECVRRCLSEDGLRTVNTIVEISEAGRAPKNDPAILALAMACADPNLETRRAAYAAIPRVCRIGTHLFHFMDAVRNFRGMGRGLKNAIARWYDKSSPNLAYQVSKYQQRDGWSHRDILRLVKPVTDPSDKPRNEVMNWVVGKLKSDPTENDILVAHEAARRAENAKEIEILIRKHGLVRESIPTQFLKSAGVWDALLEKMPMTAMVRNLPTMTRVGLIAPMSDALRTVTDRLNDVNAIKKARVHPISLLAALKTYESGRSVRGSHTWSPVSQVVDALDASFYKAFDAVEPTNRRHLIGLDVSGSMSWANIAGIPNLTPREGAAALSLVTASVEPQYHIMAFGSTFVPVTISPRERLDSVLRKTSRLGMMGTDCSLPMTYALEKKIPVDIFVVITDNETWAGRIHPFQALNKYREKMGIDAKLAVIGMTSTDISIADPDSNYMVDYVGFDTSVPTLLADFATS